MKKYFLILFSLICLASYSQTKIDTTESVESVWDQGVPICPDDNYINNLMDKIDIYKIRDSENSELSPEEKSISLEIGLALYSRKEFEGANWWFNKSINSKIRPIESQISASKEYIYLIKEIMVPAPTPAELDENEANQVKNDQNFIKNLPQSYDNLSKEDLKKVAEEIDNKIKKLIFEKDSLQKANANQQVIDSKTGTIKTLSKEKDIIDLTVVKGELQVENKDLEVQKSKLRTYLIWAIICASIMGLSILALLQRKTIKVQDKEIEKQLRDINKKNTYLEHAARIIRHDMHSGINTYIPRGINSLEKRVTPEELQKLKIDGPVKMIKEGLNHTQKVYKSVYEFTNLVKQNVVLDKTDVNLKDLLNRCILTTSYSTQVEVEDLPNAIVNETLFWNAIDNLIKNGLKYNKSESKKVKIYMENEYLIIEDNGIGLTQNKFDKILSSYSVEKESESGLGLNICFAILKEHKFDLSCDKIDTGTKMKIKIS